MRHPVSIEQRTAGEAAASGEIPYTWSDYTTTWVDIVPQTAREYRDAAAVRGDMTHLIKMRFDSGVTNQMRLKYGARTLNIVSAINVGERDRELQLVCVEEV
jgi:SPP1 family predicted phage head-tail adaptor